MVAGRRICRSRFVGRHGRSGAIHRRNGAEPKCMGHASRKFSNCRYSQLDRINTSNAKYLRPAWTMPIGRLRGHERQPLVMYLMTLNAKSGAMEWKFQNGDPKLGQTVTAATQVFKDIVMVGISDDEPGTATNGRSVPRRAGHSYAPYGTSSLGREHQPSDRVERA